MADEQIKQGADRNVALDAYKILAQLLNHEEIMFWRRNEVLLALNGGLVAILGLILPEGAGRSTPLLKPLPLLVCAIGIVLFPLWLIIVRRSEAFYNHWYEQAKFLEKEYLVPIRVFQVADEFFSTGQVTLGGKEFRLDRLSSQMRIYHALIALPIFFLATWTGLLVYYLIAL